MIDTQLNFQTLTDMLRCKKIKEIHLRDEVSSTNDEITDFGIRDGVVLAAKRQTCGRGRLGRSWKSNGGGIYFSIMLTPKEDFGDISFITLICAQSVFEALSSIAPCSIKWPNDIILGSKKVCGILTQAKAYDKAQCVICGIGINTNAEIFDDEIKDKATSLYIETGKKVDENKLLCDVLERFEENYYFKSKKEVLNLYKENCITLNSDVTVHFLNGKETLTGKCVGISQTGELEILCGDGQVVLIRSGEVSVRRGSFYC